MTASTGTKLSATAQGVFVTTLAQLAMGACSQWLHHVSPHWSSSLWFGSGAALGCVLLGGPWMLLGVYLGLIAYHFLITGTLPVWMALLLPLANVAETSLAWFLLTKVARGFQPWMREQRDIVIFLIAAPWIPALVSALTAQILLSIPHIIPRVDFQGELITYALGNAGGIILITPLILLWRDIRKYDWTSPRGRQMVTFNLFTLILISMFFQAPAFRAILIALLLPQVVWGVWINGLKGATISFFLLSFLFVSLKNEHESSHYQRWLKKYSVTESAEKGRFPSPDLPSQALRGTRRTEEVGVLILFCITMFPLGLAADTLRAKSQRDSWVMDSIDSSLWTWSAVTGYRIDQGSVSEKISKKYALFSGKARTGQIKIPSKDPSKPAYLSHWRITQVSATGEPLEVTGLLHCLRLEERAEKAEHHAEISRMEVATLRSRFNPHLLFNCLTGLRAVIQRNPSHARDFVTRLARFLRTAVDSQLHPLIPIEQEVALCLQYLELENIRGKKITCKTNISRHVRNNHIPPMSIQTLVENAVQHGHYTPKRSLWIRISARVRADGKLCVSVSQPGKLNSSSEGKTSAGIALVRHHLALLYHSEGTVELCEKQKGVVTATILVPMERDPI